MAICISNCEQLLLSGLNSILLCILAEKWHMERGSTDQRSRIGSGSEVLDREQQYDSVMQKRRYQKTSAERTDFEPS